MYVFDNMEKTLCYLSLQGNKEKTKHYKNISKKQNNNKRKTKNMKKNKLYRALYEIMMFY